MGWGPKEVMSVFQEGTHKGFTRIFFLGMIGSVSPLIFGNPIEAVVCLPLLIFAWAVERGWVWGVLGLLGSALTLLTLSLVEVLSIWVLLPTVAGLSTVVLTSLILFRFDALATVVLTVLVSVAGVGAATELSSDPFVRQFFDPSFLAVAHRQSGPLSNGHDISSAGASRKSLKEGAERIDDLISLLPPANHRTQRLLAHFRGKKVHVYEDRSVGFGGRLLQLLEYEASHILLDVLSHQDRVAKARIRIYPSSSDEKWDVKVRHSLFSWIGDDASTTGGWGCHASETRRKRRYSCTYTSPLYFSQHLDSVTSVLGRSTDVLVSDDVARAVRTLTSPFSSLHVREGRLVGWNATGQTAMEMLIENGTPGPIRLALRGPNPEGRVYAAKALLALEARGRVLDKKDRETIRIIRTLALPIYRRSGCLVDRVKASDLLP